MESKIKIKKIKIKPIIDNVDEIVYTGASERQDNTIKLQSNLKKNFLKFDYKSILNDKKKLYFTIIPSILFVILFIASIYLWNQLSDIKNDPLKAAQVETTKVVKAIGQLMVLPSGEMPKLATLTEADLSKVKTQSFFVNAKVGDKVLVYSVTRKVILYNPNINKIVEVSNLDVSTGK